jgi:hypothetical protein
MLSRIIAFFRFGPVRGIGQKLPDADPLEKEKSREAHQQKLPELGKRWRPRKVREFQKRCESGEINDPIVFSLKTGHA